MLFPSSNAFTNNAYCTKMAISTYKEALNELRKIDELVEQNAKAYMLSLDATANHLSEYAGFGDHALDLVRQYILERIPIRAEQQKSTIAGDEGSLSDCILGGLDFQKQKENFRQNMDAFDACAHKLKKYYKKRI